MESGTLDVVAGRTPSGVGLTTDGRNDDEDVFEAVYDDLRRFAAVVGRVGSDPDDLVQEALSRVLRNRSLVSLEDPGRYLRVVVLRLAANERRRAAREERALGRLSGPAPYEPIVPGLQEQLAGLRPRERAVLYLGVVEGRQAEEIAQMLGMRPGAVRTAKSRALKRLRSKDGGPIRE